LQVIADRLLWDAVKASPVVREGASEEEPVVKDVDEGGEGEFTVCWDPLDGSSIVDNNWAVGTMIGIWPKKTGLIGATGRDQVTSLVALYGPRTTVLVALEDGTYEFTYGCTPEGCQLPDGSFEPWICSRQRIKISPDCKIFAPANLRAAQDLPGYKKLIDHFMENRYTLRYSGGLVPDVYQQFTKEQGIFANPTSAGSPAKLRLAFEAAPFGLLVEKSGGKTSDGVTGGSILDVQINSVDQRTALCIGSANEVDRFNGKSLTKQKSDCLIERHLLNGISFPVLFLGNRRDDLHGRVIMLLPDSKRLKRNISF
jgi:sedoheptulose-bisphosphatase